MDTIPRESRYSLDTLVTGSGPGLLLAHGAGGGVDANFGPLLPLLAADHTVVGSDYPGSGDSPVVDRLDLDRLADSLVGEAAEAGLERFTVLGYSLGTAVALRVAHRHPGRVRGLVLGAGLARAATRPRLVTELWDGLLERGDLAGFARLNLLTALSDRQLAAMSGEEVAGALREVAATVPPGAVAQARLVRELDVRGELAGVGVPTLVVAAGRDGLVPPDASRELAEGIPGAAYTVLDAGHLVLAERPAEWWEAVSGFLARHGL
ncbi:alpha/beta fold hydrolase [Streptomyces sp. NPDC005438]|uniref:alpha/beta fold hydrolase n=1 Tax=Streptomyces sp. NPDC005438 TaxID=3156880 RepID=UPI0033A0310D